MTRIALTLCVAVGLALGAGSAAADDAPPAPCAPNMKAAIDAAFPGNTAATCVARTTPLQVKDNRAEAGTLYQVRATVSLPDGRVATVDLSPDAKIESVGYAHSDLSSSTSKGMALLFWAFALASVVGAVFVITRRNLIAAVMGMVGSFLGIAAVYMLLYAQFLAVVQMLVYAGAIMVLFVFVVMILNRPEDEPVAPAGRAGQAIGGLAILYFVGRLVLMLTQVEPPDERIAREAPRPVAPLCVEWSAAQPPQPGQQGKPAQCARSETPDWGSVSAVGADLFGAGLFPFEAISILLLAAVVGAIAIARPLHVEDDAPAKARSEGAA